MEVRPGYKWTKVGVIPEEWEVTTLGEICTFENGDRGRNYPSPESFVQDGIPFVNAGHLEDGKINVGDMNYITSENYNRLGSGKVQTGDILFCLRGSLGKFGIVRDNFGKGAIASSLVIVRPRVNTITHEYLGFYFGSALCDQMIDIWSGGAVQPNLGAQDLARFSIPLPPTRTEQRAIAEVLSDVDALIAALDRLIAKKRAIKQGAMQQLLTGKTRLPGFSGEWDMKRLGEVAELKNGYAFKSTTYSDAGDFKVITIANVQDGYLNTKECNKISAIPENLQSHQRLVPGDILISMTGNVGRVCVVNENNCLLNQRVGKLIPTLIDNYFFFHLLRQRHFLHAMMKKAKGGAQGNLSISDISEFEFTIPLIESEQRAIAEVLSDMDAEIAALEARRDKTRALKQGMMQELLTGRTRLIDS